MRDVIYILTTVVFFGLMLAYLHGCDALGRGGDDGGEGRKP
jgi:hypothetical protein